METLAQLIIAGVAIGSIYGLISLGFLTIFHSTGVINFSQGDMLMVGSVVTFAVLSRWGLGYPVVIVVALVAAVALTAAFRFGLMEPLLRRGASTQAIVLGTIAFGLALQEVVALLVGDARYSVPPIVPNVPIIFGGVAVLPQTLIAVVAAWAMVGLVWAFFTKTLAGKALRAVGMNRIGAAVAGVRVPRLITLGVLLSVTVTVIAGVLIAPIVGADPRMGLDLAVKGFAAAILAGLGSVYWAMVAGVGLGILEQLGSYYVSNEYAPLLVYVVLIVALIMQPRGSKVAHS